MDFLDEMCLLVKSIALVNYSEEERKYLKNIFESKEIVIETEVRYGKIVSRFIPIPVDELIKEDFLKRNQIIRKPRRESSKEEAEVPYSAELDRIENTGRNEPFLDLNKLFQFSKLLETKLPKFINQIIESLDTKQASDKLIEYQTATADPNDLAEKAKEIKTKLDLTFLAKYKNEEELKGILGIKQGGKRKRPCLWTTERKVAFFEAVESIPKIKNKSCWQFALDELKEQGFDVDTINWIKSREPFKNVPDNLFNDAIKLWQKYLYRENWEEMPAEEKPRAFEYRHALHLIGFVGKATFSTLETYYYHGRKIVFDFQNET